MAFHLNGDRGLLLGIVHLILHAKNVPTPGTDDEDEESDDEDNEDDAEDEIFLELTGQSLIATNGTEDAV